MFRKIQQKLQTLAPELELELAKYILITIAAAVGLFIVQQIPLIRAILSQVWSINIFNFLLTIFIATGSGSTLTYLHLRKRLKRLTSEASTDEATGVLSKKILNSRLEEEMGRAKTNKKALSIILIDIDGFKRINDTYDHGVGDSILKEFAQTLKADIRGSNDALIRYGGDEFLIIAPGTEGDGARYFAERLRSLIEIHQFQIDSKYEKLTLSAGVTELIHESDTFDSFLKRADDALKEAKKQKNRAFLLVKKQE